MYLPLTCQGLLLLYTIFGSEGVSRFRLKRYPLSSTCMRAERLLPTSDSRRVLNKSAGKWLEFFWKIIIYIKIFNTLKEKISKTIGDIRIALPVNYYGLVFFERKILLKINKYN